MLSEKARKRRDDARAERRKAKEIQVVTGAPDTHARARRPTTMLAFRTREERVLECMRLMAIGSWERGATGPQLARMWKLTEHAVRDIAAEASRRVKSTIQPEGIRTRLAVALDEALDQARGKPREVADVARAWAHIVGVGSTRVEMEHSVRLPPVLAMLDPPPTMEEVERFVATGEVPMRGQPSGPLEAAEEDGDDDAG